MILQSAIAQALPELRAEALARMTSTATVRRKTGRLVQDETTGLEVPAWADAVTGSPCRIGGANTGSSGTRNESTPGGDVQLAVRTAHLPHATADVEDGDFIEVTAGETAGTVWRVIESERADQQTAYRLPVQQVQRPEEWAWGPRVWPRFDWTPAN